VYKRNFDPKFYTKICKAALSDDPQQNTKIREKVKIKFKEDIIFPLTILEDHFVGACLCYTRLRNRSEDYRLVIDNSSPGEIMSNVTIKELHAYEYFFFSCCGYIYKELKHEIKKNTT
jgi:hypothetical protein